VLVMLHGTEILCTRCR